MLKHMRSFPLDDQSAILEKVTAFSLIKLPQDIDDMDLQCWDGLFETLIPIPWTDEDTFHYFSNRILFT